MIVCYDYLHMLEVLSVASSLTMRWRAFGSFAGMKLSHSTIFVCEVVEVIPSDSHQIFAFCSISKIGLIRSCFVS